MARRENGEAVNDSAGRTDGHRRVEPEAAIGNVEPEAANGNVEPEAANGRVKPEATNADTEDMDLSKVLGDVYADDVPPPSRPSAPEWADEAHLDEAFANWTPGPPPEAPAAEHEMAAHDTSVPHRRIDDDLAAALTQALSANPINPDPVFTDPDDSDVDEVEGYSAPAIAYELAPIEPEPEPVPEPVHNWSRGDDDVLPAAGGKRRGRFSRLSR